MLEAAPPVTLADVQKRRDDIIAELHWECPGYYEDHEFELNGDFDEYLLCLAQDCALDDVDYELYCEGLLIGPQFAPSYKRFVQGKLMTWVSELHTCHAEGYITLPAGYFPWIQ